MNVPIYIGKVSRDTDCWYQLDYYDRQFGVVVPWMVLLSEDLGTVFRCYDFAQGLVEFSAYTQYFNLFLVRRDGSYQCLRTNSAEQHMRSIEPFGIHGLVALHQLRTAGDCRG